MSAPAAFEVAVVGGGIVGVATAMALLEADPSPSLVLLEKEARLAAHQSGHNSGVVHSGLYYRPGSLKARCCVAGREALQRFCGQRQVPFGRCGKLVVATQDAELPALDELERRGRGNGLQGIERLDAAGLLEREPHAAGIAALWVPETGIVDFARVTESMAGVGRERGGAVRLGARVRGVRRRLGGFILDTPLGDVSCRAVINCAGLHSDRIARLCGVDPGVRIVPFRGEYYELTEARRFLVRNLIYPVPDPAFPVLGVHLTRMLDGTVEAGPNAVLSLKREGYGRFAFSPRDALETLGYRGFRRLARRCWRAGLAEYRRSFSKGAFAHDLRRLVPELRAEDLVRGGAGVRAQPVDGEGRLLDDFHLVEGEGMIHVLNAPSPAATASLSIGGMIAARAREAFGWG